MTPATKSRQSGSSLVEAMIAIVVLSFGILGLARFQIGMLAQTTDSQSRLAATALADELLSMVRVDIQNATCYTRPASGTCSSPFAATQAKAWSDKAAAAVPTFTSFVASMPDAKTFQVALVWNSKAFKEPRTLQVSTDARY
jgi:type IV pilus assembly protein PilV